MEKISDANGRILALDYGLKRTGLAVTDPQNIIAQALDTVLTTELFTFLDTYLRQNSVSKIVLGLPKNLDNTPTHATQPVLEIHKKLSRHFAPTPIILYDERYTSKMAVQTMVQAGKRKKYRREKKHIDRISATILLQSFLEYDNLISAIGKTH